MSRTAEIYVFINPNKPDEWAVAPADAWRSGRCAQVNREWGGDAPLWVDNADVRNWRVEILHVDLPERFKIGDVCRVNGHLRVRISPGTWVSLADNDNTPENVYYDDDEMKDYEPIGNLKDLIFFTGED